MVRSIVWPELGAVWGKLVEGIERSFHKNREPLDWREIVTGLCLERIRVFEIKRGGKKVIVLASVVVEHSEKKVLIVSVFGNGGLALIEEMTCLLTEFAQLNNCTEIYGNARKGWVRRAARYGWAFDGKSIAKEVEYE